MPKREVEKVAKCKHSYILIQKTPYERVFHCALCHEETKKITVQRQNEENKEEESSGENK